MNTMALKFRHAVATVPVCLLACAAMAIAEANTVQLDGLTATMHVQRFETEGDTLRVVEHIVVRNDTRPERMLTSDRPIEMQLPPEARVESGIVQAAGAQPLPITAVPVDRNGRYQFPLVALPPGETRFAIVYRLPYDGKLEMAPKFLYPVKQFAVVVPESMKFATETVGIFRPMLGKTGATIQVTGEVKPGQPLTFRVSGRGTLTDTRLLGGREQAPSSPSMQENDGWLFLGAFALVVASAAAGIVRHRRKQSGLLSQRRPLETSGQRTQALGAGRRGGNRKPDRKRGGRSTTIKAVARTGG